MGSDPIMLRPGIVSLWGREGGAFEGASWHAGKLTRGDPGIAASAQDMMGSGPSLIRCACQKVRPDPVFGPKIGVYQKSSPCRTHFL